MPTARAAADCIVTNARIRTLDRKGTLARAIAAKDGRIAGIGTEEDLEPLRDRRTEVIDAGGKTILPGFIDGHTHFQKGAISRHLLINWEGYNNPGSIKEALQQVRQRALALPPGEWLRADGLAEARLAEKRMPTKWEIDEYTPDRPAILVGMGNHSIAANSMALQAAGITRDTQDPPGGKLERTPDGEPTGVLRETGKLRLDPNQPDNVIPKYKPEQRLEPLKATIRELHSEGITSIHDMMVDPYEIAAWMRLHRENELEMRVQMLIRGIETKTPLEYVIGLGFEHGFGDEWLSFGGIKLSLDGVWAYRAAAVYEPYDGEPDNYGLLRFSKEELDEKVALCHQAGVRVAVHVVGPRAIDLTLDAFEKASNGNYRPELRHRLEHCHVSPSDEQLERIKRMGFVVSVQPSFVWKLGDAWLRLVGGKHEKLSRMKPLRRIIDLGIPIMGGTDFPGTPVSPFLGLRSALTRLSRDGEVIGPEQAITLDEALRLQTSGAAYGGFDERCKGTLELGKLADLIVVSQDPYEVPPDQLNSIKVDLTMVGGRLVFRRQ